MKRALPFLLFLSAWISTHAQVRPGQTILWRISGNGLTKPSYLFGTMHVNTREAFYFKDSLYRFMDQAEAFAMEIHPDSTGEIFQALYAAEDEEIAVPEGVKDIKIDTAAIQHEIGLQPPKDPPPSVEVLEAGRSKPDSRSMRTLMSKLMGSVPKKDADGMDVFMDAFLYRLALSGNKQIYGLEKMKVQIDALKSLGDGINVKNMDELLKNWDPDDESPLNKYYYKEDLDSIDYLMTRYFNDAALDKFLYKRNIGMARQMDSIMKTRSLFTAVGTGHLGGPKGIISLLRQKGYRVDPVYSDKRIYAGDVKIADKITNWNLVKDTVHGFSVEVPGKVTEQAGEAGRMVRYVMDMAGGITYMTISGRMTPDERAMGTDSFFMLQVDRMTAYADGKIISKKDSSIGNMLSKQAILIMKDKSFTRINEVFSGSMFYLLLMASMKEETLHSASAGHFLNSLKMLDRSASAWRKLDLPDEGMAIEFPGKPKEEITEEKADNGNMISHILNDASSGMDYYLYTIRPKHGFVYNSTESFFESYISSIRRSMQDAPVTVTDTVAGGCPARYYLAGPSSGKMLEGIIVKRDNTGYYLMTEYEAEAPDHAAVDRFLHSFRITPFRPTSWKTQTAPDKTYSTFAPAPFLRVTDVPDEDSLTNKTLGQFGATETNTARVYSVEVQVLSPYDWAPDLKTVFDRWRDKALVNGMHHQLSYEPVQQNGLEGRDIWYQDTSLQKKVHVRYFLNGERVYILEMTQPQLAMTALEAENEKRYFDEFKTAKVEPVNWITKNTPDRLFRDLQSKDSVIHTTARAALDEVSFDSTHIRMLMEKSLLEYPDFSDYKHLTNNRLFNIADRFYEEGKDPVNDPWVLDFIRQHYSDPGGQIRSLQYDWLSLLAGQHHEGSYTLIKELLARQFPVTDDYYYFFDELERNPALTKILFPDLLKHLGDTTAGSRILALTRSMIDSSQMKTADLEPYWPSIEKLCRKLIADCKKLEADGYDYDYNLYEIIPLLGYFKQKKADDLLRAFQQLKVLDVKKEALVALFKNSKTVSQPDLLKLLAVDNYTVELYKLFKEEGKTNLLPPGTVDQKKMARGYLYSVATEDADDEDVKPRFIYIKTIEREEEGVKKKYYLFRMELRYGDEQDDEEKPAGESYLAVAGPFDTDPKKLLLDPEHNNCGVYYEEEFDGAKLEEHFKKLLEQFRE